MESRTWTCPRCEVAGEAAVSASPDLDLLCSECTAWTSTPGSVVRESRARLGLTQEAYAARLGTTRRNVENWEQGHRRPHPLWLDRIRAVERELAQPAPSAN